jgi:hypothetical protein
MVVSAAKAGKSRRYRRTRAELAALDEALIAIVKEYQPITIRGVFYRAEIANLVAKEETAYAVVQRELAKLRRAEVIPYGWITDGTRIVQGETRWGDLRSYARHAADFYHKDYWHRSPVRVEVWVEKDALSGVIYPVVVEQWGLDLYVPRGFSSITYLYSAAESLRDDGRPAYIYTLGDFDPSGLCASEKIAEELPRMAPNVEVHVTRIAVTPEQIRHWDLPTRDVKLKDSRAKKFIERYGEISVELDAIPPTDLRALVSLAIARHADGRAFEQMKLIEEQERDRLASMLDLDQES